ncbi:MAG TPA: ribosome biogenesis GTPase YlqF [Clostridia bacterium]|nr:ribosome biogenesis GTPase YlqF [Clostridia bacterium]
MKRALRSIEEMMDLVDLVVETVDARIPKSGRNPLLFRILKGKTRVLVLTKSNLADPNATRVWMRRFREQGENVLAVSVLEGFGGRLLESALGMAGGGGARVGLRGEGPRSRGDPPKRIMVVGIPNSGKSTLINAIAGKRLARTGKRPGITRGYQLVKVEDGVLVLDTPGVLPIPWLDCDLSKGAWRLAAVGALEEGRYDHEEAAMLLLDYLLLRYPGILGDYSQRQNTQNGRGPAPGGPLPDEPTQEDPLLRARETLTAIAGARGCIGAGGSPDLFRASSLVLREFRDGKMGRVTLE